MRRALASVSQITSPSTARATTGTAFTYQITATGSPTQYYASGLPQQLTLNTTTGLISGTPTTAEVRPVLIQVYYGVGASLYVGAASTFIELTVTLGLPVITSTLSRTATAGSAFSYQITATNSPTSYSASNLPAGLSINTSTGVISGTPTSAGSTSITINATNATGTGAATLALIVNVAAPVVNSALSATAVRDVAFSYQITATNNPTSYSASNLPTGLSVNTSTGVISGTPTSAVVRNVTIGATNSTGTGTATLALTVNAPAPVINSTLNSTATVGAAFSYQITATNSPTSYSATNLPSGLSVNTSTGVISGTPTSAGSTSITINATNATGTGTASLTLTASYVAPVITSALSRTAAAGSAFNYQITATNNPTSYSASNLPAELSINTSTGAISGTPTSVGTTSIAISASNPGGTGSANLTVSVVAAPVITNSSSEITARVGTAFSYQITATNSPTSYSATNLPSGLSVNTSTGVISGTPSNAAQAGNRTITIYATNAGGTGSASRTLILEAAPVITSASTFSTEAQQPGSAVTYNYNITASNNPTSYSVSNLPQGLSLNTTTGNISGAPFVPGTGTYTVTISATNAAGTGSATLTITALSNYSVARPKVSNAVWLVARNVSSSYSIEATNNPMSFSATGLPAGMTLADNTSASRGTISGTPTVTGSYTVQITASNAGGSGDTATIALEVVSMIDNNEAMPAITSSLNIEHDVGEPLSYVINASNYAYRYVVFDRPSYLGFNNIATISGAFSGYVGARAGETITLEIGAFNNRGAVKQNLTIAFKRTPVTAIAADGFGGHIAMAVKNNGVIAWGNNDVAGQLNIPSTASSGVSAVALGQSHCLALKSNGSVIGWGSNTYNQTTIPSSALSGVTAIAAGSSHNLALKSDGSVIGWGLNTNTQRSIPAAALSGVTAIAAGGSFSVALKNSGVIGWGVFYVVAGTTYYVENMGSQISQFPPSKSVIAIAAGTNHVIALNYDGSVNWGMGWGNDTAPIFEWPASVTSEVTAIAAGGAHNLALKYNGSVVGWGNNDFGQISIPYEAQSGVIAIQAGYDYSLAIKSDGRIIGWGTGLPSIPTALSY
jgi:PKD repeat protein